MAAAIPTNPMLLGMPDKGEGLGTTTGICAVFTTAVDDADTADADMEEAWCMGGGGEAGILDCLWSST